LFWFGWPEAGRKPNCNHEVLQPDTEFHSGNAEWLPIFAALKSATVVSIAFVLGAFSALAYSSWPPGFVLFLVDVFPKRSMGSGRTVCSYWVKDSVAFCSIRPSAQSFTSPV
jgi:hypothetical protein